MIKKYYKLTKDFNFFLKIKNNNLNILWYPKIDSEIDLIRELCRAVWYLNPIKERINVFMSIFLERPEPLSIVLTWQLHVPFLLLQLSLVNPLEQINY